MLTVRDVGVPVSRRNELTAINAIRTIHIAQVQYYSQFNRYAASLKELGPPQSGLPGAGASGLIGSGLASGAHVGYSYVTAGTETGYSITAHPQVFNTTGSRSFYSDQTMAIHQHYGLGPATAQDPELK